MVKTPCLFKTILGMVILIHALSPKIYAVQGELNYDLPTSGGGEQVMVEDLTAVNQCKDELKTTGTYLKNCQDANGLMNSTQDVLKSQKNLFFWLSIGNGLLAFILGTVAVLLAIKVKKMKNPTVSSVS